MATLLVDGRAKQIRLEDRTVRIIAAEGRPRRVPIALLDRVVVTGAAMISSTLITALAGAGVPLIVVPRGRGDRAVAAVGGRLTDAARRLEQYRHLLDTAWRAGWSARLVAAKLLSQQRFLKQAARVRPDLQARLLPAAAAIEQSRSRIRQSTLGIEQLLGVEGAAAKAYFAALTALFPPSLGFQGRNRRPPRDPVNACLSLGYTLLHYQMTAALSGAGLDPYLGFYHAPDHGRESLAADLIEPQRTRVDQMVWDLFRTRTLRREHFGRRDGACILGKAGRRAFYESYEKMQPTLARGQRRLCRLVVKALTGEDDGTEWTTGEETPLH